MTSTPAPDELRRQLAILEWPRAESVALGALEAELVSFPQQADIVRQQIRDEGRVCQA